MNKLSKVQKSKLDSFSHFSTKIRYLNSLKYSRGDISRMLSTPEKPVIYQWVKNVLDTNVKTPKESF